MVNFTGKVIDLRIPSENLPGLPLSYQFVFCVLDDGDEKILITIHYDTWIEQFSNVTVGDSVNWISERDTYIHAPTLGTSFKLVNEELK